jgi:REP element-mobilizing transposase RayT
LFGSIANGQMNLSQYGEIVRGEWEKSTQIRAEIELGDYVIMPNHFHAIVFITGNGRGDRPVTPTMPVGPNSQSIGALMAGFKCAVTRRINQHRHTPGNPVWQRNYWEHIIRTEQSRLKITAYINNNPVKWESDKLYLPL